jgi:mono/diheme cytochrome c family protein
MKKNHRHTDRKRRRSALLQAAVLASLALALLGGCALGNDEAEIEESDAARAPSGGMMPGMGMGPGSGMMQRHSATIPTEYADLTSPVEATEASLEQGGEIYIANCATCHGDGGMGDGPTAANLDPVPVAIAHTSQMVTALPAQAGSFSGYARCNHPR